MRAMLNISTKTQKAIYIAAKRAFVDSLDETDFTEAILRAFLDNASLADWAELETEKP